jgi:hypothetical protein
MSEDIGKLKSKVDWLERRIEELEKEHGTISVYVKSSEEGTRNAVLTLVEALGRVAHGSPHLSPEEQAKIKRLLGIG